MRFISALQLLFGDFHILTNIILYNCYYKFISNLSAI